MVAFQGRLVIKRVHLAEPTTHHHMNHPLSFWDEMCSCIRGTEGVGDQSCCGHRPEAIGGKRQKRSPVQGVVLSPMILPVHLINMEKFGAVYQRAAKSREAMVANERDGEADFFGRGFAI